MQNPPAAVTSPSQTNDVPAFALQLFQAIPGNNVLLENSGPGLIILAVSEGYLQVSGRSREELEGKDIFDVLPFNSTDPVDTGRIQMRTSFQKVISSGKPDDLPIQRYDAGSDGRYWKTVNTPMVNDTGGVSFIVHTVTEVTQQINFHTSGELASGTGQAYNLFMQAPVSIYSLKGHDLVIEMANKPALDHWDRDADVIGQTLAQALPELAEKGADKLLLELLKTGETRRLYEAPVTLKRNGKTEEAYFNFIYKPYFEDGKPEPAGIIAASIDVTDKVLSRKELAETEEMLRLAVEIGGLGIFKIDLPSGKATYSQQIVDWFSLADSHSGLAEIFLHIHPEDIPAVKETIERSIAGEQNGRHDITYRLKKEEALYYLRSIGQVQWNEGRPVSIFGIIQDVTQQVLSTKKIEESQRELLRLFEESPVGIADTSGDDSLVFHWVNPFYGELVGRKPEEIINKPLLEALPELKGQGFDILLKQVIATKKPFTATEVPANILKNGKLETIYVNLNYQPRKTASGDVNGVLVVATDVTQQVTARKKVEESEQRYRSLFESMNQGFCVLEMIFDENSKPLDYRFMEINPVFENQTGLRNAIGKTALELVPNLEPHWFELYGNVALTGKPTRFVEGSEAMDRWFDVYAFRMGDAASRKVALLFSDISERRKAENSVRHSEQNLRSMILQSPVAIAIYRGPDWIIEIANQKMLELVDRPEEDLLHKPLFASLPEAKSQGLEELLTNVANTGEPFYASESPILLVRDGKLQTFFINYSYVPLRTADDPIAGIMVVAIDVTDEVRARQKIEEVVAERTKELADANELLHSSNKELKRSNAHLEEFAHAASHDLKEPVRKIHFFTHQLKTQLGDRLNEAETLSFTRIENATQRMGTLIDDLLLYSHVSLRPHLKEDVELGHVMQRVLEDLDLSIQQKNAVFHIGELPTVQGYRRQLQQLFQNLISNAIKYSKDGIAPEITITSSIAREKGQSFYVIKVQDNGIGFEQHYEDKIFQMFQRLHGKNEYGGTGVGLSIVKKVVENHEGSISVLSSPGEGAAFEICLP